MQDVYEAGLDPNLIPTAPAWAPTASNPTRRAPRAFDDTETYYSPDP